MEIYETFSYHAKYENGTNDHSLGAGEGVDGLHQWRCYRVDSAGQLQLHTTSTTSSRSLLAALVSHPKQVLIQTLLPIGFPHSVKKEYLEYQCWDAVQGLCSYLRAVLTTRSVLASMGVGNTEATALSAALSWVLKDGVGMVGSLCVAYCYANSFEVYTKEWRLLADVLNNVGLTLDLLCSMFPSYYFVFLVISSVAKSCCGLIAGATKARISSHFAHRGHLADVSAKESTQETAIALLGLVLGMLLAKYVGNDEWSTWLWFLVFTALHSVSNYHLMRVLVFHSLNTQRLYLIAMQSMDLPIEDLEKKACDEMIDVLSPKCISQQESLWLPCWLQCCGPQLAVSLQEIQRSLIPLPHDTTVPLTFARLLEVFQGRPYILSWTRSRRVLLSLEHSARDSAVLEAYYLASCLTRALQRNPKLTLDYDTLTSQVTKYLRQYAALQPVLQRWTWELDDAASLGAAACRYRRLQQKPKEQ